MLVVIVLNYNDYKTTIEFVNQIKEYSCVDNIIIVDNCSTDESFNVLQGHFLYDKKITVLHTDKNNGYASGNNYGIKFALDKYKPSLVCISNPDIIVKESVINELIGFSEEIGNFGVITSEIYDINDKRVSNFFWEIPTFFSSITSFLVVNKFRQKAYIKKKLKYKQKLKQFEFIEVDAIPGCFFMADANAIFNVNLLDETTFLYGEETILAYKLKNAGYKNYVLLGNKIIHQHSVSINRTIKSESKKIDLMKQSRIIFLKNYLNISQFGLYLFRIMSQLQKLELFIYQRFKGLLGQ